MQGQHILVEKCVARGKNKPPVFSLFIYLLILGSLKMLKTLKSTKPEQWVMQFKAIIILS